MSDVIRRMRSIPWQNSMKDSTDTLGTLLYVNIVNDVYPLGRGAGYAILTNRDLIWRKVINEERNNNGM